MPKLPILGKVAGFVLTIDPANERGKCEEIRFDNLVELIKKSTEAIKGVPVGPNPRVTISTVYLLYEGTEEVQEGYDLMAQIDTLATKAFCANDDCDRPVGWTTSRSSRGPRTQSGLCIECHLRDMEADADGHYDRLARADEKAWEELEEE